MHPGPVRRLASLVLAPALAAAMTLAVTPTIPSHAQPASSGSVAERVIVPGSGPKTTGLSSKPSPRRRCVAVPSRCGFPDATNTGPTAGRALIRVPTDATSGRGWRWNLDHSSVFVRGRGAVLNRLDIAGGVVIDAPNVTLRNSRISSCGGEDDSDVVAIRYEPSSGYRGANASVIHNEILGTPAGCAHRARSGVRDVFGAAPGVLVQGNDISGAGNGITVEHEGLIRDNWIHDLGHLPEDHHSGISSHGGAVKVRVRHNTVLLHGQEFPGGGGVSGALTVYSDFGHAQNVTLRNNFVSGGSYVIYGGNSGDDYSTPATSIKIIGNRFVCGDWLYGPVAAFSRNSPGNVFRDNFCDGSGRKVRG